MPDDPPELWPLPWAFIDDIVETGLQTQWADLELPPLLSVSSFKAVDKLLPRLSCLDFGLYRKYTYIKG